ncbi:MAG: hypothetical protein ACRD11_03330, partial [Terriglobia bacterium]
MIAAIAVLASLILPSPFTHLPGPQSKQAAELRSALQAGVQNYLLSAANFADALVQVAGRLKIPMGIVWVPTPQATKPVRISWRAATAREVIEGIVRAQPGYEIEERNAVLHVFPRGVPARENCLNLEVPHFVSMNDVAEMASRRLDEFTTLKVMPPKPVKGPARGGMGGSMGVEVGDPNISLDLANATVAGVLDAISLASPFKVWLVAFAPEGNVTATGFRRTMSPTSGKIFPD